MQRFHVQLVDPARAILREQRLDVMDLSDVWRHIEDLAETAEQPGLRIKVVDDSGEIVVMVGVATARQTLHR